MKQINNSVTRAKAVELDMELDFRMSRVPLDFSFLDFNGLDIFWTLIYVDMK